MSIFHVIALCGGLSLFLYGMRIMGDGLKHGSSGALAFKNAVRQARLMVETDVTGTIRRELEKLAPAESAE